MRVLIVEDEALVANYLEALVLSFDYKVCAVAVKSVKATECLLVALFGPHAMSDLSPLCAHKRTYLQR